MDILFTFEDGSKKTLTHSGVKGMHWGKWNEETRRKYEGGKISSGALFNAGAKSIGALSKATKNEEKQAAKIGKLQDKYAKRYQKAAARASKKMERARNLQAKVSYRESMQLNPAKTQRLLGRARSAEAKAYRALGAESHFRNRVATANSAVSRHQQNAQRYAQRSSEIGKEMLQTFKGVQITGYSNKSVKTLAKNQPAIAQAMTEIGSLPISALNKK